MAYDCDMNAFFFNIENVYLTRIIYLFHWWNNILLKKIIIIECDFDIYIFIYFYNKKRKRDI